MTRKRKLIPASKLQVRLGLQIDHNTCVSPTCLALTNMLCKIDHRVAKAIGARARRRVQASLPVDMMSWDLGGVVWTLSVTSSNKAAGFFADDSAAFFTFLDEVMDDIPLQIERYRNRQNSLKRGRKLAELRNYSKEM